jgi:hypothetical protein
MNIRRAQIEMPREAIISDVRVLVNFNRFLGLFELKKPGYLGFNFALFIE